MKRAKFGICLGLGAMAAVSTFFALPAQSYEGVVAPPAEDSTPAPASSSGYSGVIAPKIPDRAALPPAGYKGLLPGSVQQPSVQKDALAQPSQQTAMPATADEESLRPQFGQRRGISTAEELKALAEQNSLYKGLDINSPEFSNMMKLPPRVQALTDGPRSRIEGLLPTEYVTKAQVEETLKALKNNVLSAEARRDLAKKSYDALSMSIESLRYKKSIPEIFYKKMGVSDVFLQEEREGDQNALRRLEAALEEIKGML